MLLTSNLFNITTAPFLIAPLALREPNILHVDLLGLSDEELSAEFDYTSRRCRELMAEMEDARALHPAVATWPAWRLREMYNETAERYEAICEEIRYRSENMA